MKLKKLRLKNFRGYVAETEIDIADLNVIIGRNDVGKSSILEALDIFFNGKPDKDDLSVNHDNSQIEITCIFNELPETVILDDTVPTTLIEEHLLNSNGDLEIRKRFPVSGTGSVSEEAAIVALYPSHEDLDDLLSKKRSTLKLQFEDLGIAPEGVNRSKSKELRLAIISHFYPDGNINTTIKEIKIDGRLDNEDNRKKIWSSLRKYLPVFSLFFVDKPLNDQDSDIQDPMKEIIKEVLKRDAITPLLEQLKTEVQAASTAMADITIAKLNELDSALAETLRSTFPKEPSWSTIFKLALEDDRGVPLNKRGSGMRRLVLLSFFRAQVENRISANAPDIIYALEEPETSQHPDFQLMIVNALKELADTNNAQVLFTTHNSNLAKEIPIQALRYAYLDGERIRVENGANPDGSENTTIMDRIVETLGALPDPKNKVKVLLFVEGENDVNGLIGFSKLMNADNTEILTLEECESVAFIPTGGSQLKYYIEKKYLDGLLQSQVHVYDSDIADYVTSVQNLNAEGNPNKVGYNTTKSELENYLHHEAINECYRDFNIELNLTVAIEDSDDVPLLVAKQVHSINSGTNWEALTEEKQKKKVSRAKRLLNTVAVEKMTIERLQERGGYDEIKEWLDKVKDLIG